MPCLPQMLRAVAGRDRGPTVASTRARPTRGSSGVRVGAGRAAAASRDAAPPSPTRRERRDAGDTEAEALREALREHGEEDEEPRVVEIASGEEEGEAAAGPSS